MAKQTINIGTTPSDDTGDTLYVAFDKCNDNFTELYTSAGSLLVALTDATTIAVDATAGATVGATYSVTLGGNRTLGNPTGAVDGQVMTFRLRQDATGSRTLALGSKYRLGTTVTSTTLTTTAGKTDYLTVRYYAADDKFDVVAFVKGF